MTEQLAVWSSRRPWLTLAGWMVAVVAAIALTAAFVGDALSGDEEITSDTDSRRADELQSQRFAGERADRGVAEVIVVRSPTATVDQRAVLEQFVRRGKKATTTIETACVEICESRFDRVLFSVIDTPGLDFLEGRELKLERQVNDVIKYVDAQYADTMSEVSCILSMDSFFSFRQESKVVRKSKGDQHIHLYVTSCFSIQTCSEPTAVSTWSTHRPS